MEDVELTLAKQLGKERRRTLKERLVQLNAIITAALHADWLA